MSVKLGMLRKQIDASDRALIAVLGKRMRLSRKIGALKRQLSIEPKDAKRLREILVTRTKTGTKKKLSPTFVRALFILVHRESVRQQKKS